MTTPSSPGGIPPDIARSLADVDAHVERVARNNSTGSDLNVLAYAIHNLIRVIEKLHGQG